MYSREKLRTVFLHFILLVLSEEGGVEFISGMQDELFGWIVEQGSCFQEGQVEEWILNWSPGLER